MALAMVFLCPEGARLCGDEVPNEARKTKRPRLKESWDARPNSPPPSAAQQGI
jgi:hypothetical protein